MRARTVRVLSVSTILFLAAALWPAEALAQRARARTAVRVARPVVVRTHFYRPFYPAYYYSPYYWRLGFGWGYGWYDPFWYQRYPPPGRYYDYDEASARLEVTPKDAQVFVDGYYVGTVEEFDGVFERLRLRAGEHTLEFYRDGYRTIRERASFRRGETYRVKFAMEPLDPGETQPSRPVPDPSAAPDQPEPRRGRQFPPRDSIRGDGGALAIRVQPEEATLVIDGERWEAPAGREPLVLQVAEGSHRVEVQKEGYRTYSVEIRVRRGETVPLNVSLRPDR